MKYQLYVAEWAPNGTNDLLVVDGKTKGVVGTIQEACFGVDTSKQRSRGLYCGLSGTVIPGNFKYADEPEYETHVSRISLKDLKRKICVSPVDPDGSYIIRELKSFGITLK